VLARARETRDARACLGASFAIMIVLPAIDLLAGQAVRLHQGQYDRVTVYADDPPAHAATLRGKVPILHVVDLEGARAGHPVQKDLVRAVIDAFQSTPESGVQIGGGVRSIEAIGEYLALGAQRVVLGTAAIRDPDLIREAALRFPNQIVVALDARDGKVALDGWEETSSKTVLEVARELEGLEIAAILYTDIARDGTQAGPNMVTTAELAAASRIPVFASGGVGTLDHLRALSRLPNVVGAIVGRALYEGAFTLDEAIAAAASV
jgi:phosphoribosylformimino-5-aminoimidazole carboxamide ribotide isomerase